MICGRVTVACCTRLIVGMSYLALFSGLQSNACVVCLSRLETRTKESNMYASHWESKPKGIMKVKNSIANLRRDHGCLAWHSSRFAGLGMRISWTSIPLKVGRTKSIHVGTRKMVNYAWSERSQGKLWWRFVAILTCKSIVGTGYRGERLIEPSSSWFPPKFPSG